MGLVVVLSLCYCGARQNDAHVMVLALDGLDPKIVDLLMSEGKLPNFAEMRSNGAYGELLSMEPLLSPVVWTTIATGKTPDKHGIAHFVAQDENGDRQPVTSQMRQVSALWNMYTVMERSVVVVGWWATWPPEQVKGTIVSDHTSYHFLFEQGSSAIQESKLLTYPESAWQQIRRSVVRPHQLALTDVTPYASIAASEFDEPFDFNNDISHLKWLLAATTSYTRIALELWQSQQPHLLMAYVEGTDSASHLFGHLFRADGLAGELEEQHQKFGNTVEAMYLYADKIVGQFMQEMDDDTVLVVLSDHGFDLGRPHDDPTKTRDMRRVSEAYHLPEGILYLYGKGIRPHAQLQQASILDIAPTILAAGGLPIADDMTGRVLTEAFVSPPEPVHINSYDSAEWRSQDPSAQDEIGDEVMEHLRSLGYIGTSSSSHNDRNLAAIHYKAGNFAEAELIYRKLLESDPNNAHLHTSLAGVLGTQGRLMDAETHLLKALDAEPDGADTYHNLGVVYERRGNRDQSIAAYREALRCAPDYQPAKDALIRLGYVRANKERTAQEQQALLLAEQARELTLKGSYEPALSLLDQAEKMAPNLALLQQYRANIAYSAGDEEMALRALRRGLDLDPGNLVLQRNLDHFQSKNAKSDQE